MRPDLQNASDANLVLTSDPQAADATARHLTRGGPIAGSSHSGPNRENPLCAAAPRC